MVFPLAARGNGSACAPLSSADKPQLTENKNEKILIAYYSATGNTGKTAEYIAKETGGDLFKIVPAAPCIPDDLHWRKAGGRVNIEYENESRRDTELVKITPDRFAGYDSVDIGYPKL